MAFHALHDGQEGKLDSADIERQMAKLNEVFPPVAFRFSLADTTYTDNATWFRMVQGSNKEIEAKQRLG